MTAFSPEPQEIASLIAHMPVMSFATLPGKLTSNRKQPQKPCSLFPNGSQVRRQLSGGGPFLFFLGTPEAGESRGVDADLRPEPLVVSITFGGFDASRPHLLKVVGRAWCHLLFSPAVGFRAIMFEGCIVKYSALQ